MSHSCATLIAPNLVAGTQLQFAWCPKNPAKNITIFATVTSTNFADFSIDFHSIPHFLVGKSGPTM